MQEKRSMFYAERWSSLDVIKRRKSQLCTSIMSSTKRIQIEALKMFPYNNNLLLFPPIYGTG